MTPISRAEALSLGQNHYFTGRPCSHGHVAARQISSKSCVECVRRITREHYQKNKQDYIARAKAAYLANPEAKKAAVKERYRNRTEEQKQADRDRHNAKSEQRTARADAWRKANPERYLEAHRATQAKRRALSRAAQGAFSGADVREMLASQNNQCNLCAVSVPPYHVDHIRPLAKGGSNERSNLQILCPACNLKKSAKWPAGEAKK